MFARSLTLCGRLPERRPWQPSFVVIAGGSFDGPTRVRDGSGDGPGRLRAAHADRERVIDTLKAAYVYGLVTKNELDERLSQTFAARTHAQLAVITADIPSGLAPLRPAPARASAPAAARDRAIMATAILTGLAWVAAFVVSPDAGPRPSVAGALAALLFVGGTGALSCPCSCSVSRCARGEPSTRAGSCRRGVGGLALARALLTRRYLPPRQNSSPAPPGRGGAQPTQPSVTPCVRSCPAEHSYCGRFFPLRQAASRHLAHQPLATCK